MNAYCIVCGRVFELPTELPNEPDMTCWSCKSSSQYKYEKEIFVITNSNTYKEILECNKIK